MKVVLSLFAAVAAFITSEVSHANPVFFTVRAPAVMTVLDAKRGITRFDFVSRGGPGMRASFSCRAGLSPSFTFWIGEEREGTLLLSSDVCCEVIELALQSASESTPFFYAFESTGKNGWIELQSKVIETNLPYCDYFRAMVLRRS